MGIEEDIKRLRTGRGGWTRKQLAGLGVPWPPPKGWKNKLLGKKITPSKKNKKKNKVLINDFYKTERWIKLRYRALKLSNGKCELCGVSGKVAVLNVDHIKSRSRYPGLRFKLSNLQVLCATCNHGKGWRDETDWRDEEMKESFLNAMHKEERA